MIKVEAVVISDRVETVIDAVEAETGHIGVTVVEATGRGRQCGVPEALLTFIVPENKAQPVLEAICTAAISENEAGDGLTWMSSVYNVRHNRTGKPLHEYVEAGYLEAGV